LVFDSCRFKFFHVCFLQHIVIAKFLLFLVDHFFVLSDNFNLYFFWVLLLNDLDHWFIDLWNFEVITNWNIFEHFKKLLINFWLNNLFWEFREKWRSFLFTFIEKTRSFLFFMHIHFNILILLLDHFNQRSLEDLLFFFNKDITPYFLTKSLVVTVNKSEESAILSSLFWWNHYNLNSHFIVDIDGSLNYLGDCS